MRAFLTIWSGQLVSLIGSQLTGFALGVWVYQETHSVLLLALVQVFGQGDPLADLAPALFDVQDDRLAAEDGSASGDDGAPFGGRGGMVASQAGGDPASWYRRVDRASRSRDVPDAGAVLRAYIQPESLLLGTGAEDVNKPSGRGGFVKIFLKLLLLK